MSEKHLIVLGDGTEIEAGLNGNTYLPTEPVDDELLDDLILIGREIDGVEQFDMTVADHWTDNDGERIVFRQYSEAEKSNLDINAKIEYIAMMGGIDL